MNFEMMNYELLNTEAYLSLLNTETRRHRGSFLCNVVALSVYSRLLFST